ncbi:MAG: hypothetical protein J6031_00530 [Bacteroidales bacterium]|nr:hypothetical protein [Bacteroidales bacterium]
MITVHDKNKIKDPELEEALEAIRMLKADHTPDVTDAVMQRISNMQPLAVQEPKRRPLRIVSGLAAACFAGIVVVTFIISHRDGVQAANISPEMPSRLFDIYQYCSDYGEEESIESAAYYDNPITDFI